MHRLSVAAIAVALTVATGWAAWSHVVQRSDRSLALRGEVLWRNSKPFSGVRLDFYPNHRIKEMAWFWKGLEWGTEIHWHADGGRWVERGYHAGQPHGDWKMWYPDGRVKFFGHYLNGKPEGEFWAWHPNGAIESFTRYEQGQVVANKVWISDGTVYHNYVRKNGERIGVKGGDFCKQRQGGVGI